MQRAALAWIDELAKQRKIIVQRANVDEALNALLTTDAGKSCSLLICSDFVWFGLALVWFGFSLVLFGLVWLCLFCWFFPLCFAHSLQGCCILLRSLLLFVFVIVWSARLIVKLLLN